MFYIESFEQKYVIIKVVLQSDKLKQHMITIGVDQSLINSRLYETCIFGKYEKV